MGSRTILITIEEAAYFTGKSPSTIRRWLSEGRLTRHGRPRATRIDYMEIRHDDTSRRAKRDTAS